MKLFCKEPNQLPSLEELEKLVTYNADSGKFFYHDGREAFTAKGGNGYLRSWVFGKRQYAHRLAWLMGKGTPPTMQIDHIDGDRSNNSLANLREASPAENMKNRRKNKNNRSGYAGVYEENGKWIGSIQINGKKVKTLRFENKTAAAEAAELLRIKHGFHANHGH